MCGTRIEKEVETYATSLANKTKCMSTNALGGRKQFVKTCIAYFLGISLRISLVSCD
jgi:hypothetical protein